MITRATQGLLQNWSGLIPSTAATGDSIRKKILAALASRLQVILVVNGYKTNLGAQVAEWETAAMDPNVAAYRMEYRDADESGEYAAVGQHYHQLPVELRITLKDNSTALATIRSMIADVTLAIGVDTTFGGLAQDTNQDGNWVVDKGQAADVAVSAGVKYLIEYTTAPWDPYTA